MTNKNTNLVDVFERNKYNMHKASRASRSWFDQQILLLTKQNAAARTKASLSMPTSNGIYPTKIVPGKLYLYRYDAKTKHTLPYWDMFPMVFPYEKTADGFIGLNFHYLPYQARINLLSKLLAYSGDKTLDERTRLKYSWGTIVSASKFQPLQKCVKRYLSAHVVSRFREIPPQDWTTALMLPAETFIGADKTQVWKDTMRGK